MLFQVKQIGLFASHPTIFFMIAAWFSASVQSATFEVSNVDGLIESLSLAESNAEDDTILVKGTILTINERIYLEKTDLYKIHITGSDSTSGFVINSDYAFVVQSTQSTKGRIVRISNLNVESPLGDGSLISSNAPVILEDIVAKNMLSLVLSTYERANITTSRLHGTNIGIAFDAGGTAGGGKDIYISDSVFVDSVVVAALSGNGGQSVYIDNSDISFPSRTDTSWCIGKILYGSTFRISNTSVSSCKNVLYAGYLVELSIFGSRFKNISETAVAGQLGREWRLESNVFSDTAKIMAHSRYMEQGVTFINNTVINADVVLNITSLENAGPVPITFSNNAFYNTQVTMKGPDDGLWRPLVNGSTNYFNLPSNFQNSRDGLGYTKTLEDFGFIDFSASNYQLAEQSPLIDMGDANVETLYQYDALGQTRQIGGSVDVGAYEFVSNRPTITSFSFTGEAKAAAPLTFFAETLEDISSLTLTVDFGGGFISFVEGMQFIFSSAGAYPVTLRVMNDKGVISSRTIIISVRDLTLSEKIENATVAGRQEVISNPSTYGLALVSEIPAAREEQIAACLASPSSCGIDIPNADIDGNGTQDALTDGLLILRYSFGLTGDSLIGGVVAEDATRTTAEEIEAYLATLMPSL
jgi:hypothetical protein